MALSTTATMSQAPLLLLLPCFLLCLQEVRPQGLAGLLKQRTREDGRCGPGFPAGDGGDAQCEKIEPYTTCCQVSKNQRFPKKTYVDY